MYFFSHKIYNFCLSSPQIFLSLRWNFSCLSKRTGIWEVSASWTSEGRKSDLYRNMRKDMMYVHLRLCWWISDVKTENISILNILDFEYMDVGIWKDNAGWEYEGRKSDCGLLFVVENIRKDTICSFENIFIYVGGSQMLKQKAFQFWIFWILNIKMWEYNKLMQVGRPRVGTLIEIYMSPFYENIRKDLISWFKNPIILN